MRFTSLAPLAAFALTAVAAAQRTEVDPRLPAYTPASGVSGSIKAVGSDTMNNMMALWTEGFRRHHPGVTIETEGKGSGSAPPALIEGTATFGPMSRAMKPTEVDDFREAFGYEPVELRTSIDMLAVYVHKDNPIQGLSLEQVDAVFSRSRKGGHARDVVTWGDLGLEGEWARKPISLYGRNSSSGTYGYFQKNALFGGDYKDSVKEQPGSAGVVQGVASDRYAIGYSGIGYKTADVRAVPLAAAGETEYFEARPENASGDYPLARFLYLYVNRKPNESLDPLRLAFVKYVFSEEGQSDVVKDGYIPVPFEVAARALASVGEHLEARPVSAGYEKQ